MFKKFIENKSLAGVSCCIWKDDRIVFQESYGYKKLEPSELLEKDAIFRISSMTKPITSVIALMLYEEKKLDLQDPITKWFPQFAEMKVINRGTGKLDDAGRVINVLDLLTHKAGFTYGEFQSGKLRDDYKILGGDIDTELSIERWLWELSKLPLLNQPGEIFNYGRSTDLLGILISTIEGKPLAEVMNEKLFAPLGMADTFFEVPSDKRNRCVSNFGFDDQGKLTTLETVPLKMAYKERPSNFEFQSGGQGLWSTISDYLAFAQIFIKNGNSNGKQILKNDTVALMCTNHLTPDQKANSTLMGNTMFKNDFGFGLGVAVVEGENKYASIPCCGSIGSIGWPGAYGGWWSADPVKKTISIFLTHSMTTPEQLGQGIGFELYEAIDIFSNQVKYI
ncbi:MAG TPA: serine hydrolase domain-containing protein [Saprospiraceae bacterium]|nr:serine hydrolase domain-containing protein [Saprospiraceae bacterium]